MIETVLDTGSSLGFESYKTEIEFDGMSYQFVRWDEILVDYNDVVSAVQNPVNPNRVQNYADSVLIVDDSDIREGENVTKITSDCCQFLSEYNRHLDLSKDDFVSILSDVDRIDVGSILSRRKDNELLSTYESKILAFWNYVSDKCGCIEFQNMRIKFKNISAREAFATFFDFLVKQGYILDSDVPVAYNENRWLICDDTEKGSRSTTSTVEISKGYKVETSMSNPRKKKVMRDFAEDCIDRFGVRPIELDENNLTEKVRYCIHHIYNNLDITPSQELVAEFLDTSHATIKDTIDKDWTRVVEDITGEKPSDTSGLKYTNADIVRVVKRLKEEDSYPTTKELREKGEPNISLYYSRFNSPNNLYNAMEAIKKMD